MNEYTLALCLFLFGTACVAIGWAVGRVEAKQEYKTRLAEQHHQILDLYRELDKEVDKAHDLYLECQAEMKRMGVE
jgi:lipopolysaccharide biosynthesis regulator YciM